MSPPPRPPSPKLESFSRTSHNFKESSTLQILADFKHRDRPLPKLVPFPYEPEKHIEKQKYNGRVPKPSKFVKGSMYSSDYESDLEGTIPTKWRAYNSDTEDSCYITRYRKVRPKFIKQSEQVPPERKPSPPCPHKWESHDDIERLEAKLRQKKHNLQSEVKLLNSLKLSNTLESSVSETSSNILTQEFKSCIQHTSTQDSKTRYSQNGKRQKVSDDESPKFESVNFQTSQSPDKPNEVTINITATPLLSENTSGKQTTAAEQAMLNTVDIEKVCKEQIQSDQYNQQEISRQTKNSLIISTSVASNDCSSPSNNATKNSPIKSPPIQHDAQSSTVFKAPPPPPLPAKGRLNAITPSNSSSSQQTMASNCCSISDEQSHSSQSTVKYVVKEEFVSVKEKAKLLQQKLEEQEYIAQELEAELIREDGCTTDSTSSSMRQTPTNHIRPHDIPGAVRVLPPAVLSPNTSRPNSTKPWKNKRSCSLETSPFDIHLPFGSPAMASRSSPHSPLTVLSPSGRRLGGEYSATRFRKNRSQSESCTTETDRMSNVVPASNQIRMHLADTINDACVSQRDEEYKDCSKEQSIVEKSKKYNQDRDIVVDEHTDTPPPPRPPMPDMQDYNLSSSDGTTPAQRNSYTEFASSSMTELAYSSTSMERRSTSRGSNTIKGTDILLSPPIEGGYFTMESSSTRRSKSYDATTASTKGHGDRSLANTDVITDSELESDPHDRMLGKEDIGARKRQNKSPRQSTPTNSPQQKQSPKLARAAGKQSKRDLSLPAMDGYEADTDDTLSRAKRRTVKDLAKSFQEAENACPSPLPFRPKLPDGSDYESSDFEYHSRLAVYYIFFESNQQIIEY